MAEDDDNLGPTEGGKVRVKLAHSLNPEAAQRLGLDPEDTYSVNDVVEVRRDDARAMIGAGLVQVDPEDAKAVASALGSRRASVEPAQGDENAPAEVLRGDALEEALDKRGLPSRGTANDKRKAVADYDAQQGNKGAPAASQGTAAQGTAPAKG